MEHQIHVVSTYSGHAQWKAVDHDHPYRIAICGQSAASVNRYAPDVHLWNIASAERTWLLTGVHSGPVEALCFSPDGSLLATADSGGAVAVWSVQTGELQNMFDGYMRSDPDAYPHLLAWVQAGRMASVAINPHSHETSLRVWEVASGLEVCAYPWADEWRPAGGRNLDHEITALACSASGLLAYAKWDGRVVLWEPGTPARTLIDQAAGQSVPIVGLTFSPDGQRLLVNGTHLWSIQTAELLALSSRHADGFASAVWLDDARVLCATRRGKLVYTWHSSGTELKEAPLPFQYTPIAWALSNRFIIGGQPDDRLYAYDCSWFADLPIHQS